MSWTMPEIPFETLKGKILKSVKVTTTKESDLSNVELNELLFETIDGKTYKLYHEQDCCECVMIESIVGDLSDLEGEPILMAEEVAGETGGDNCEGHYTWTFYKLATRKGYVDIRWYGSSNGYYSESVSFCKVV
jgi:hypothetical protein